jgi:hypothetical protein
VFIAATVPVEHEGDISPLLDAANEIGNEIRNDTTETPKDTDHPDKHHERTVEAAPGSFEKFMATLGRGR